MSELAPEVIAADEISGELCPILPTAIDPDAASVLRRLLQAGHRAYLVGGCVRDLLLGVAPKDFDIATSARPRQVKKLFRNARIIGRRFRLVHVMFGRDKQIEVSTFRRDPGDGSGDAPEAAELPEVAEREAALDEFGDDARGPGPTGGAADAPDPEEADDQEQDQDLLIREDNVYGSEAEDAVRRDFTINGLFFDVQTQSVIDYVAGVADLRRRILRTIGDPSRRIREDPVRILRAVKFSTRLRLALDPLLASAMAEHHEDLRRSAPPRVFEEILRILGGVAPARSIEVLVGLGVMRVLFPELGLRPHGADEDPRLKRLLARLTALEEIDRGHRSLPTAIYLGVLFHDEMVARLVSSDQPNEGHQPPPSQALDDFLRPIGQRCRMAKRDTARARAMFLALRRIDPLLADPQGRKRRRRGGLSEFVRREFFDDALLMLRIVCMAEGRDLAPVFEWERRRDELVNERPDGRERHDGGRPHPHAEHPRPQPLQQQRPPDPRFAAPHDPAPVNDDAPAANDASGNRHRRRRRRRRGGQAFSGGADDSEPA